MSTPTTPNCGNPFFPQSCPIILPTDGIGGTCYNISFPVPTCGIYDFNDHLHAAYISVRWSDIDTILIRNSVFTALQAISLGLASLTLLNVLVLTPSRKRGLPVHTAIVLGLMFQIVQSGTGMYLVMSGRGTASPYLQLTKNWAGTEWSGVWKGLVTVQNVVGLGSLAGVQGALFLQSRGLLVWVRVRYGLLLYRGVLAALVVLGCVCFVFRAAFAGYQIYWIGFARVGDRLSVRWQSREWLLLREGSAVCMGVSLGGWSMVFVVSAAHMLWERRKLFLGSDLGDGLRSGGKKTAQTAWDRVLNLIGCVGVESFLIPLLFSILSAVPYFPEIRVLLVPSVLAFLPMSSLLIQTSESNNGRENTPAFQHSIHPSQMHMTNHPETVRSTIDRLAE